MKVPSILSFMIPSHLLIYLMMPRKIWSLDSILQQNKMFISILLHLLINCNWLCITNSRYLKIAKGKSQMKGILLLIKMIYMVWVLLLRSPKRRRFLINIFTLLFWYRLNKVMLGSNPESRNFKQFLLNNLVTTCSNSNRQNKSCWISILIILLMLISMWLFKLVLLMITINKMRLISLLWIVSQMLLISNKWRRSFVRKMLGKIVSFL